MKLAFQFLLVSVACRSLAAAEIDFAHNVAPILKQHCGKCHTGDQQKGGLSLNTRESLLSGGESGKVISLGKSSDSDFIKRLTTSDNELKMPPEGPRVSAKEIAILKQWVDSGLKWEDGFTFGKRSYEPPLKPRRPELPPVVDGRSNPVDRILDADLSQHKAARPQPIDDATFARRAFLDIVGLLPTPEELTEFKNSTAPDKRERLVDKLLARDLDYAEHWLTFWNDLLRNDYTGTGFITGGRKQISKWLYQALVNNAPYDRMARELIAPPTPESAGFADGIRWRGDVSAGQTVEIQFAQSVGQSFLGINLKCASCHDSFIDRWKLEESYGLAAIYSNRPLEIHRCDKPIGKQAQAGWLFPELGTVDPKAPQPERLKQLANLMTHPENGRFTRTIVNRIWHRLMGRGIVHPTDAMQTEPFNADLLDHLAVHLSDSKFDLKQTIALIAKSQAYQSRVQLIGKDADDKGFVYGGPRAKRLTAEQFVDAVWQLTGSAPTRYDAPIVRSKPISISKDQPATSAPEVAGSWIWSMAESNNAPANETVVFRKLIEFKTAPTQCIAAVSCDNSYTLFVNGQKVHASDAWERPEAVPLTSRLKAGQNEILIIGKNGGSGPNPAGLFFAAQSVDAQGKVSSIGSDGSWQWTSKQPNGNGKYPKDKEPDDWQSAALCTHQGIWGPNFKDGIAALLNGATQSAGLMVRASLVKNDFLMKALGRPNRDQIVSVRPTDLSTLEAIDLSNGQTLADALARGAKQLAAREWTPSEFVAWVYHFSLARNPSAEEQTVLLQELGSKLSAQGVEDVLWSIVMLPEFQLVR